MWAAWSVSTCAGAHYAYLQWVASGGGGLQAAAAHDMSAERRQGCRRRHGGTFGNQICIPGIHTAVC